MAQVLVNDSSLAGIGAVVRRIKGEYDHLPKVFHTNNLNDNGNFTAEKPSNVNNYTSLVFTVEVPEGTQEIYCYLATGSTSNIKIYDGSSTSDSVLSTLTNWTYWRGKTTNILSNPIALKPTSGYITVSLYVQPSTTDYVGVYVECRGNFISNGVDDPNTHYYPSQLVTQLQDIKKQSIYIPLPSDGVIDNYFNGVNSNNSFIIKRFINNITEKMVFNNINSAKQLFYNTNFVIPPVEIHWASTVNSLEYAFSSLKATSKNDLNLLHLDDIVVIGNFDDSVSNTGLNNAFNYTFSNCSELEGEFDLFSSLETIFPQNMSIISNSNSPYMNNTFDGCNKITAISFPVLKNIKTGHIINTFNNCYKLSTISMPQLVNTDITNAKGTHILVRSNMFCNCYSLRSYPEKLLQPYYSNATSYATNLNAGNLQRTFYFCLALDAIENLGVIDSSKNVNITSNMFSETFSYCSRLKKLTFQTNNGTPITANYKSQVIELQTVGYMGNYSNRRTMLTNRGSTIYDNVYDSTTYETYKNSPNWYSGGADIGTNPNSSAFNIDTAKAYSRYNHDSAVETINSLPDTSAYLATAGGTNTIKFLGAAGSATDGGAISDLTAAEIAVATGKGWTVTLV